MKVLMVNKFIFPKGGAETVALQTGEWLKSNGHEVEYYGITDAVNAFKNRCAAYARSEDFHTSNPLLKLSYAKDIVYDDKTKADVKKIIEEFKPDLMHMHNINFHLTPSIIDAARECNVPVIWTIHDFQLMCPNHLFMLPSGKTCEKCYNNGLEDLDKYKFCIQNKCIHNSLCKSIIGVLEAIKYRKSEQYKYISKLICPSKFIKGKLDADDCEFFREKTVYLQNYVALSDVDNLPLKGGYGLFFGRLFEEKGIRYLMESIKDIDHQFLIAGTGPMEQYVRDKIKEFGNSNIEFIGFKKGRDLIELIARAKYAVYPSLFYENCPMSILEAISLGTPILSNDVGGNTELLSECPDALFDVSKGPEDLTLRINRYMSDEVMREEMLEFCERKKESLNSLESYCHKLLCIYQEVLDGYEV